MLPGSRHAPPLSQRPNSAVGVAFEQTTGPSTWTPASAEPAQPQQSLLLRQTSPVGRQPDGGWHTLKPESAPKVPHDREQQLWSQAPDDVPPSVVAPPVHTVPAGAQPLGTPPPLVGAPQAPVVAPAAFTQLPPQHSKFVEQISPCCVQKETALEHTPLLQRFEQQSAAAEHGLPAVRQVWPGLTLAHVPFVQMPLQQSPLTPHAPAVGLSGTHCLSEQAPSTQEPVQHSFGATHATPGSLQAVSGGSHVLVPALQFAEQQSVLFAQVWPVILQVAASFSETSLDASLIDASVVDCASVPPEESGVLLVSSPPSAVPPPPMSEVSLPQPAASASGAATALRRARTRQERARDESLVIRSSEWGKTLRDTSRCGTGDPR